MKTIARIRTSVVCCHHNKLLMIDLEDPLTRKRMWSLPGGQIEQGETPKQAAIRETFEETGYAVSISSEPLFTEYKFRWNSKLYNCQCHWFFAYLENNERQPVNDANYLKGSQWMPFTAVPALLSYHPHIQQTTLALIEQTRT